MKNGLTMLGDERDFEMNASNNEDDGPVNAAQTNTKPSVMALTSHVHSPGDARVRTSFTSYQ